MTAVMTTQRDALHLLLVDDDGRPMLVTVGRFGCDYAWTADNRRGPAEYIAYRCLPHRWLPGSDESYAAWQAGEYDEHDYRGFAPDEVDARGEPK